MLLDAKIEEKKEKTVDKFILQYGSFFNVKYYGVFRDYTGIGMESNVKTKVM